MKWWRDRSVQLEEVAERLTRRDLFRVDRDSASLDDRGTVRTWLLELRPARPAGHSGPIDCERCASSPG
jgi:hypothetical protein